MMMVESGKPDIYLTDIYLNRENADSSRSKKELFIAIIGKRQRDADGFRRGGIWI